MLNNGPLLKPVSSGFRSFQTCVLRTSSFQTKTNESSVAERVWGDRIKDLLSNGPSMVMCVLGMLTLLAGWMRGSAIAYYFTHYAGSTFGDFLVAGTVASIGLVFAASAFSQKIGSAKALSLRACQSLRFFLETN